MFVCWGLFVLSVDEVVIFCFFRLLLLLLLRFLFISKLNISLQIQRRLLCVRYNFPFFHGFFFSLKCKLALSFLIMFEFFLFCHSMDKFCRTVQENSNQTTNQTFILHFFCACMFVHNTDHLCIMNSSHFICVVLLVHWDEWV